MIQIKGVSSHLVCISKCFVFFLITANCFCFFFEEPFAERTSWAGWEPMFLDTPFGLSQTQGRGSTCQLGGVSPYRAGHQARSGSADHCPGQHTNEPNAGIHWKYISNPTSPEFSRCWTGLCSPCPSAPTHTHHPNGTWICMCSSKILHPHLLSHSALEVNIIKYSLILKYRVSILQCALKVPLSHVKRSLN